MAAAHHLRPQVRAGDPWVVRRWRVRGLRVEAHRAGGVRGRAGAPPAVLGKSPVAPFRNGGEGDPWGNRRC